MSTVDLAAVLRGTQFAERVEHRRRRGPSAYEPWPAWTGGPAHRDLGTELCDLLHTGAPARDGISPQLSAELVRLGLADERLHPGRWEVTAFRGILAVRDRADGPAAPEVYIGEDSLRFVDTILQTRPGGHALDIGSGSGITTCALARTCDEVTALDLNPRCAAATRLSAELNGHADRIRTILGDFTAHRPARPLECVVANLPYVPVPPGLGYSPAGNGGPDGLSLNRELLDLAPELLDPAGSVLLMRFQSRGTAAGPAFLDDVRKFASRTGYDVSVVADGRMPAEVRAALTALHARSHNPATGTERLLSSVLGHVREIGGSEYFSCSLVGRSGGSGEVVFTDLTGAPLLDSEITLTAPLNEVLADLERFRFAYMDRCRDLPDGFWELGGPEQVHAPARDLGGLLRALDEGHRTTRALVRERFASHFDRDLLGAHALHVTAEVAVRFLVDAGVVRAEPTA